jgi:hypothetical protein
MLKQSVVKKISCLIQLHADMARMYEQTLQYITPTSDHQQLKTFQQDHLKCIVNLCKPLYFGGGRLPEIGFNLYGLFTNSIIWLRSLAGPKAVLKALQARAQRMLREYDAVIATLDFSQPIAKVTKTNYLVMSHHFKHIEEMLEALSIKHKIEIQEASKM